jgi:Uncharacterized conserved protein (DUF2293)
MVAKKQLQQMHEPQVVEPSPTSFQIDGARSVTLEPGWTFVRPGDPALTRRVRAAGAFAEIKEWNGRHHVLLGLKAPLETVQRIRTELATERSTPAHQKRKLTDARRREKAQVKYVEDFLAAVLSFLAFHRNHADLANRLARAVADHATPVGSGTVARTKRIPVEKRAEAAVIAWMRHQTTGYESMAIPRVKGERRAVRRMLAERSHDLLACYRRGEQVPEACPLQKALEGSLCDRASDRGKADAS